MSDDRKISGVPSAPIPGAIDRLVQPIGVLSLDDSVLRVNSAMRELLGWATDSAEDAQGLLSVQLVTQVESALTRGVGDGTAEVPSGGGSETGQHLNWSLLPGSADAPRWVVLSSLPARLSTAWAAWLQILSYAVDLAWTADDTGTVLSVTTGPSPGASWLSESLLRRRWLEFVHPDDRGVADAAWERALQAGRTGTEAFDARGGLGDGAWRWFHITLTDLRSDAAVGAVIGTAVGASEMVIPGSRSPTPDEALRSASGQDPLTGLHDRAAFVEAVDRALAVGADEVSVLFANLDAFRSANDSLGRAAGDEILFALADRIRRLVGDADTAARVGADEFALLIDQPARVERLGPAVLAAIAEPLAIDGVAVRMTAAVGVASSRHGTAEELVHRADMAMRAAKASGPGVLVTYDQGEADATEREEALGPDLQAALARDELDMNFQPIIDLTTGDVLGMEALARWTHATLGPVDPRRIVSAADRFGLSTELDHWALRTAFRAARTLQRSGATSRDAYVSVNLMAGNLAARGLEDYIVSEVAAAGLTPAHVLLEMTETALMEDSELVTGMLRRLRTRGFRIAIDDFGTGYSSLAYLRDLPVSMLKIDRSFVAEIRSDSDALAIVASIIDLARAIGVTAVAKGAETPDQAGLLRELGCECAQGWLWSPAVSLDHIIGGGWRGSFDVGATQVDAAPVRRERFPVGPEHGRDRILAMHAKGASLSTIAASLNADGYLTPKGLRWHGTSVARALADAAFARLAASKDQTNPA